MISNASKNEVKEFNNRILTTKYLHLIAWYTNHFISTSLWYILKELDRAEEDGAPENATFFSVDKGRWSTFEDIKNEQVKQEISEMVERYIKEREKQ